MLNNRVIHQSVGVIIGVIGIGNVFFGHYRSEKALKLLADPNSMVSESLTKDKNEPVFIKEASSTEAGELFPYPLRPDLDQNRKHQARITHLINFYRFVFAGGLVLAVIGFGYALVMMY